jgi:hypothetical protein
MEAQTAERVTTAPRGGALNGVRRFATETKQAFKTTEFWAMVGAVVAILIAGAIDDGLGARQAWLYVTIAAAAYIVSRGLAKSGSSEPVADSRDDGVRQRR